MAVRQAEGGAARYEESPDLVRVPARMAEFHGDTDVARKPIQRLGESGIVKE